MEYWLFTWGTWDRCAMMVAREARVGALARLFPAASSQARNTQALLSNSSCLLHSRDRSVVPWVHCKTSTFVRTVAGQ